MWGDHFLRQVQGRRGGQVAYTRVPALALAPVFCSLACPALAAATALTGETFVVGCLDLCIVPLGVTIGFVKIPCRL